MSANEQFFLVFAVLGGMTLFLFGMTIMSRGLRAAAGNRLRAILYRTTHHRSHGFFMGTLLGLLAHSGPTMMMLIGFVNAGLITLEQSIAPMLGANVGTTLAMQLVSFRLDDYCFVLIATGFLLHITARQSWMKGVGEAAMGFGLLFLGMKTMSAAIAPHRDAIAPILAHIHGDTLKGLLTGLAVSTLLTVAVQSSGAVIGMCFVLSASGVFTELEQILPIVLGAHIGTCSTPLLGALGTNIAARRAALSHLLFNFLGVALGVLFAPWFIRLCEATSTDLIRQTANLHTAVMLAGAAVVLPVAPLFAKGVCWVAVSRTPPPEPSYLDEKLIPFPEQALAASIHELQRVTRICARSFRLTAEIFFEPARSKTRQVRMDEEVVDSIKKAMKEYVLGVTKRRLSRRQAILSMHITRCITDLERIGDHIEELCAISERRAIIPEARFDRTSLDLIFTVFQAAERVLLLVIGSLTPENRDIQLIAEQILEARNAYMEKSLNARSTFTDKVAGHAAPPIQGIFFNEYLACYDRIVKHAKTIALLEKQPYFWIKHKKLNYLAEEAPEYDLPPPADPQDYLDQLTSENFLS